MSMSIKNLLFEFDSVLEKHFPAVSKRLNIGLDPGFAAEVLDKEELFIPALLELYTWHNGLTYDNNAVLSELDFFSFGKLMPLEEALETNIEYLKDHIWSRSFFPIVSSHAGEYLLMDINPQSDTYAAIYLFAPNLLIIPPEVVFDDLEKLISTTIECYKKGVYSVTNNVMLEIDYDKEKEIALAHNSHAEYWNE